MLGAVCGQWSGKGERGGERKRKGGREQEGEGGRERERRNGRERKKEGEEMRRREKEIEVAINLVLIISACLHSRVPEVSFLMIAISMCLIFILTRRK